MLLSGEQIFPLVWDVVESLEMYDIYTARNCFSNSFSHSKSRAMQVYKFNDFPSTASYLAHSLIFYFRNVGRRSAGSGSRACN